LNKGIVTKSTGSNYLVKCGDEILECKIKGNFRMKDIKTTNPLAAGDWVDVEINPDGNYSFITRIYERKNYIIRKSTNLSKQASIIAANIDHAFIIVTLIHPVTSTTFIDRFLISAEAYHIPASIIFNKTDLYDEKLLKYMNELKDIYEKAGYKSYHVSAIKNVNIDLIREQLKDKVTVFAGNSGVGKTTLMNVIDDSLHLKTQEISGYHLKGKHTTTFAEMYDIKSGGMLIDTPGIKSFGVIDLDNENIANYFPEMLVLIKDCQYYNCTHTHEPNCAVKKALEKGDISNSRYTSYLNILQGDDTKYRKDAYK
jgi:ribosome biogenesis GTPase / thiamine phosphate phosphatase